MWTSMLLLMAKAKKKDKKSKKDKKDKKSKTDEAPDGDPDFGLTSKEKSVRLPFFSVLSVYLEFGSL